MADGRDTGHAAGYTDVDFPTRFVANPRACAPAGRRRLAQPLFQRLEL